MVLRIYLGDNLLNHALFIDNKCGAKHPHIGASIHLFLAPNAVGLQDFLFRIGQQMKLQTILLSKILVRLFTIGTHTNHLVTLSDETLVIIVEVTSLGGTS